MPKNGFTLIDVLVGTALLLIVFLAIFGVYQLGIKVISQSKARISALSLASQKIEMAQNLAYDEIGTISGIPPGTLAESESITRNNVNYTVKTTVVYIDDPFDGLSPQDTLPSDYKRVKVNVAWSARFGGEVLLMTDIAPKGVEEEAGGGTLAISVFDSQGRGIPQASLHLANALVSPQINAWYQTNNEGDLVLPGAPTSTESYQITASKTGFSTDRTYGREELDSPQKPHASVYEGQLTEISFSIDRLSSLRVQTRGTKGQGYPPIHGVSFGLNGAKIIGQDNGEPVYKYSQNHLTDGPAEITISNLEWDSYSFSVNKAITNLDLVQVESPFGVTTTQPIDLLPNSSQEVRLILEAENSLLVTVKDAASSLPIFGAGVRLFNTQLGGYDETQPTDENGQTFFIPLTEAGYTLVALSGGYESATTTVFVSGDTLKTINLNPLP